MKLTGKPRDYGCAIMGMSMGGTGPHIWINAHKIGGSIVRISPKEAKKTGQRLIEMAEYIENKRSSEKNGNNYSRKANRRR